MTIILECWIGSIQVTKATYSTLLVALFAALTACAVGPSYKKPAPPALNGYTAAPMALTISPVQSVSGSAAGGQVLSNSATVNPEWWKNFDSTALDELVSQALAHNPDLTAAQATLEEAQYNLKAVNGIFYPQISLGLGGERIHTSGASSGGFAGPQLYNLYTGQVSVSYYPDVFGLNQLVSRSGEAQVDIARDQLLAARLIIESNVVNAALILAAIEEEATATRNSVADQQQILNLTRTQYRLGSASQFDVLTQESQLASTQARLPALLQARAAERHLLATYLGRFPSRAGGLDIPRLSDLRLPERLPVSVPSVLVRQRPDILAAEAQLRAANAQVGEQVARMYPNLQLTGNFGNQSNNGGTFFDPASRIWNLAASIVMPLFEGGTLEAQKHAAEAAYRGVFANYQNTVLNAFRNVADVLRALQHDAIVLDAQARALRDASQAFALVSVQYRDGAVDYLSLLTSEIQQENVRIAYVQAEAQRYADTAALYVALGGGTVEPPSAVVSMSPQAQH
ncbi:MAG TPA: efflux transporter outer membrane subunit [Gammaproteobacteria bacterium]|nr:efflux transporter outer membrane subunit [Gammaproteobacteria bacterium]